MSLQLRKLQILLLILTAWIMPSQMQAYRSASFRSDGNANAGWQVEADSSRDYDNYEGRRKQSRSRFADKRQGLEEGIRRHRRGAENAVNGARGTDPSQMLKPPTVELDPVQAIVSDLRNGKPITLGTDQGDRNLAADLNILPQSMAPRTPGRVSEAVKIVDPNAKTAVLMMLPTNLPGPSSILTRIAVEAASGAECLIFQPDKCEYDPLSTTPQLTIPDTAVPFTIPGPGKHDIKLPRGLPVDPTLPITLALTLAENEPLLPIMQQVEDVQKRVIHRGPVRGARDVISDLYYTHYNIGSETYFKHMPLIRQQQEMITSVHLSNVYFQIAEAGLNIVEENGEDHFAVLDRENIARRGLLKAQGNYYIVDNLAKYHADQYNRGEDVTPFGQRPEDLKPIRQRVI